MSTSTHGPQSPSMARRGVTGYTFLLALLAIAAFQFLGCGKTLSAPPPSNAAREAQAGDNGKSSFTVDRETGERLYDPGFLKVLSHSPSAISPNPVSGGKRVIKSEGYEITLDISHQVLHLTVPEGGDFASSGGAGQSGTPLSPSFAELDLSASRFAPVAALALKAKQFDDGLYAAVEIASDAGLNHFPDRKHFILDLLTALASDSNEKAQVILAAAARLGGQQPQVPADVGSKSETLRQDFLRDELDSKVLGFYTWSDKLSQIFQRDRMLQTELDPQTARSYADALARNDQLLKNYVTNLGLMVKLTNALAWADLRHAVVAVKEGRAPTFPPRVSLFPPSRAAETDLAQKLFLDPSKSAGFNLADEMIKRLRAGTLDLKPKPNSGWYDYESYALEPLAVPDKTPEAQHLTFDETYRKELVALFKAGLALTRETHIKQLERPLLPTSAPPLRVRKPQFYVSPDLTLEPVATYYLRRARSYSFVRGVVQQAFGPTGLAQMRRLTAAGPVNLSLEAELGLMESLFYGAYLRSCEEIGMAPEQAADLGNLQRQNTQRALLTAWLASVAKDPDLGKDIRMMVPIFFDITRGKTKVWVVLGISTGPLRVSYSNEPTIEEVRDAGGKRVNLDSVDVNFEPEDHKIARIATAEVYVAQLLNRTEFRKLCDQQKTYEAILKSLK